MKKRSVIMKFISGKWYSIELLLTEILTRNRTAAVRYKRSTIKYNISNKEPFKRTIKGSNPGKKASAAITRKIIIASS